MDFITQLRMSQGKSTILVVVDRLTKYAHFIAINGEYNARMVAKVFVHEVCRLHGISKNIVSDRDRVFMSTFWQELFKWQGTQLSPSNANHPQSDGQTEVTSYVSENGMNGSTSYHGQNYAITLPDIQPFK